MGIGKYLLPLHIVIYWVWDELVEVFTYQERYISVDTGGMIRPCGNQFEDLKIQMLRTDTSMLDGLEDGIVTSKMEIYLGFFSYYFYCNRASGESCFAP